MKVPVIDLAVIGLLALLAFGQFDGCKPSPPPVEPVKVTAGVYTFDDKKHSVPPPVSAAMDKLNRDGIVATLDEVDTTDGTGDVPDQYKVSRPAAVAAGLPSWVLLAGNKVFKVVKDPRTEEDILNTAP